MWLNLYILFFRNLLFSLTHFQSHPRKRPLQIRSRQRPANSVTLAALKTANVMKILSRIFEGFLLLLAVSLSASTVPLSTVGTNATTQLGSNARLFRYPTVSDSQIAFVYAGDIWVVSKAGGYALLLTSPQREELFSLFSPDCSEIA